MLKDRGVNQEHVNLMINYVTGNAINGPEIETSDRKKEWNRENNQRSINMSSNAIKVCHSLTDWWMEGVQTLRNRQSSDPEYFRVTGFTWKQGDPKDFARTRVLCFSFSSPSLLLVCRWRKWWRWFLFLFPSSVSRHPFSPTGRFQRRFPVKTNSQWDFKKRLQRRSYGICFDPIFVFACRAFSQ